MHGPVPVLSPAKRSAGGLPGQHFQHALVHGGIRVQLRRRGPGAPQGRRAHHARLPWFRGENARLVVARPGHHQAQRHDGDCREAARLVFQVPLAGRTEDPGAARDAQGRSRGLEGGGGGARDGAVGRQYRKLPTRAPAPEFLTYVYYKGAARALTGGPSRRGSWTTGCAFWQKAASAVLAVCAETAAASSGLTCRAFSRRI